MYDIWAENVNPWVVNFSHCELDFLKTQIADYLGWRAFASHLSTLQLLYSRITQ